MDLNGQVQFWKHTRVMQVQPNHASTTIHNAEEILNWCTHVIDKDWRAYYVDYQTVLIVQFLHEADYNLFNMIWSVA